MRYQGKSTYLIETEIRWDWNLRWSLVGFTGYGETQPINEDIFNKQTAYNYGLGFRYLIAREYGMRMGVDIARVTEQWAITYSLVAHGLVIRDFLKIDFGVFVILAKKGV